MCTLGWSTRTSKHTICTLEIDHKRPAQFKTSFALTCTLSYLSVHKSSSQLYIALRCHYIIKVSTLISPSFSERDNDWIRPTTGCRRHVSFMCLSLLPSISVERLLGNLTTSISRTLHGLYRICIRAPYVHRRLRSI